MKNILLTSLLLIVSHAVATDVNATLSNKDAQNYTLNLGPGSMATIVLPENAKNVIVTRSGLIETTSVGNRIIIAGVSSIGTTPMQISTENGYWTWRVKMSASNAGNIVNVTVLPPEAETTTTTSKPTAAPSLPTTAVNSPAVSSATAQAATTPQTQGSPTVTQGPPVQPANAQSELPQSKADRLLTLTPSDLPSVSLNLQRDGNVIVLNYRLRAGARGLSIDERALAVGSPQGSAVTKPNLGNLLLAPNEQRYGTILLSGLNAGSAQLSWPYRVGTVQQALTQNISVP